MKFGIRKPSFKKSFKAKTTGKLKRKLKKAVNPLYGKKRMGFIKSPQKSIKNKIYNKTTVSVKDLVMVKSGTKTPSIKAITPPKHSHSRASASSITSSVAPIIKPKGKNNMKCPICNTDFNGNCCPNCNSNGNSQSQCHESKKGFAILGFRSGKTWKKILSIIYLAHVALFALIILTGANNTFVPRTDRMVDIIAYTILVIIFLVPYILLSRTPIKDKLPLIKSRITFLNILGCAIVICVLFITFAIILSCHTNEYKADMDNHAYNILSKTEATCKDEGTIEKQCTFCGRNETEIIPPKEHKYVEISRKEPTKYFTGSITEKCEICGDTNIKTIPRLEETTDKTTEITTDAETSKDPETTQKPDTTAVPDTTKAPETTKEPATTKVPETKPVHIHSYTDATCTTPRTCHCGATEGGAKGHIWNEATCNTPKMCSACKITEGLALAHIWNDATYTSPKTCTLCGKTEGSPLEVPGKENYHGHVYTGGSSSKRFHYEAHCAGTNSHEITWEEVERRNLGPCGTCVLK